MNEPVVEPIDFVLDRLNVRVAGDRLQKGHACSPRERFRVRDDCFPVSLLQITRDEHHGQFAGSLIDPFDESVMQ